MIYRHDNPYATHLPILVGLGRAYPEIKRVLEFGSGFYSTPMFLDRDIFPNLQQLTTCENDELWSERVRQHCEHDLRFVMNLGWEPRATDGYDLVFIDNDTEDNKVEAIKRVASERSGWVVVHDSENPLYSKAMRDHYRSKYDFKRFNPETSLVCQWPMNPGRLSDIDDILHKYNGLEPDDIHSWLDAFGELECS